MTRGVFFDAGNTILFPDYDIYREICEALGLTVELGQVVEAEAGARSSFDTAVRKGPSENVYGFWSVYYTPFYERLGVPAASIPDAIEMTQVANDNGLGIWKEPVDGLEETLDALADRGLALGIVSNSDGRLEWRLAELGILDRFDFVVDSAVVGVSKPSPDIFRVALEKSELEPSDVFYVGDYYEVDVVGARAAGMTPVLFDPVGVYGSVDCAVIGSFPEVIGLLDAEEE
jgi:putative hydrolase of the HAD superfamily